MLTLSDEGYQRITKYLERGYTIGGAVPGKNRTELLEDIGRLLSVFDMIKIEMGLVLVSPEGEENG